MPTTSAVLKIADFGRASGVPKIASMSSIDRPASFMARKAAAMPKVPMRFAIS